MLLSIPTPDETSLAIGIHAAVEWLRLAAEIAGAAIIAIGVIASVGGVIRAIYFGRSASFTDVRLSLGRYLALALEFQLGADILSTAVAPSWDQIGKLGAVAVIRTALNFFLTRELREAGHAVSGADDTADSTHRAN